MMDYKIEVEKRVEWIKNYLKIAHADGIVYGNSGGKDCTLVSILCKMATDNVVGIILPCESKRNYGEDKNDAEKVGEQYGIHQEIIDLTDLKVIFREKLQPLCGDKVPMAYANINPRLRMIALYTYAQSHNYLVAGTGNRCESTMGYFTKWGDGACDFNPIADMKVSEIFGMLQYLGAPESIIKKVPSAGLYEGQTDELEMGFTYAQIEAYLDGDDSEVSKRIAQVERRTAHKRKMPAKYPE